MLIYKGKPVCVLKENNGEHEKRYLFDAGFFELDHKVDREIRRRWLKDNFGPLLEGVDMSDINIKGIWRSNEESLSGSSLKKVLYYFRGVFACGINSTIPMIRIMERQFEDKNKFRHVLDIGCGAGTLGLIALEKARIGRITAIDSNVFALVSTMLNYQLAGRRKALNIKYGCLRKQEAWDELRRTGEFDYVLFNAAFPVDEDDPRGSDVTMYDQGGIVRNKFIDNVQELLSATGKAQVLSDSGFESQAKQNGMKVHYKGTNPEGLNFYIVSSEKADSDKDDNDTLGAQVLDAGYAMGIIITAALIVVSLLFLTLKAVIAFVVTKEFLIIFAGGLIISLIIFSGFNKLFEPIYSAYPTGFYFKDVKEVFRTIFKAYHKVWEIMSWPAYLIWKYYTFRVHEGAHYLAARALKLTVNGVDYSEENKGIARTYVKLTGLKNWKILLITLAGPLANLISGTIFLWAVDFERLTAMDWYMLPAYFGICLAALEYSTFVLNLMPTSNLPLGRGTKDGDLIIRSLQLLWKGKKTFYSYSEPEKRNAFQARRINRPGSHDFRLLLLMVPIYGWVLGSIYRKLVHGDERKIRITKKENLSREVSWAVAEKIRELQKDPERVVRVVLATGNTMVGFLDSLSREKDIDWTRVYAYHLDEYKGLDTENRYSFAYYLNRHLFSKVKGIPRENIRYVNGKDPDLNGYIREIEDNGGADIVMLGIGKNGHLGFNEPGTSFWSRMREIKLTASTIKANKPDYPDIEAMPYAYTMGLRNIFRGKHLFFVASGEGKAEIVKKALEGRVTNKVPGSLIQMHPRADIFLDEEAADLLTNKPPKQVYKDIPELGNDDIVFVNVEDAGQRIKLKQIDKKQRRQGTFYRYEVSVDGISSAGSRIDVVLDEEFKEIVLEVVWTEIFKEEEKIRGVALSIFDLLRRESLARGWTLRVVDIWKAKVSYFIKRYFKEHMLAQDNSRGYDKDSIAWNSSFLRLTILSKPRTDEELDVKQGEEPASQKPLAMGPKWDYAYYKKIGQEEWFVTRLVPYEEEKERGIFKRGPPFAFVDLHTEVLDVVTGQRRLPTQEEQLTLLKLARDTDLAYYRTKTRLWFLPVLRCWFAYRAAAKVHAVYNMEVYRSRIGVYAIKEKGIQADGGIIYDDPSGTERATSAQVSFTSVKWAKVPEVRLSDEVMESGRTGLFMTDNHMAVGALKNGDIDDIRSQIDGKLAGSEREFRLLLRDKSWSAKFKVVHYKGLVCIVPSTWKITEDEFLGALSEVMTQDRYDLCYKQGKPLIFFPVKHIVDHAENDVLQNFMIASNLRERIIFVNVSFTIINESLAEDQRVMHENAGPVFLRILLESVFIAYRNRAGVSFKEELRKIFKAMKKKEPELWQRLVKLKEILFEQDIIGREILSAVRGGKEVNGENVPQVRGIRYSGTTCRLKSLKRVWAVRRTIGAELNDRSQVLEIGAGAGTLTRALAEVAGQRGADKVSFVATDINEDAVNDAKRNLAGYQNVEVRAAGDMDEPISGEERFTHIIWNPPWFVDNKNTACRAKPNWYDPGFKDIQRFLTIMPGYLADGGSIFVIYPQENSEILRALAEQCKLTVEEIDLYGSREHVEIIFRLKPEQGNLLSADEERTEEVRSGSISEDIDMSSAMQDRWKKEYEYYKSIGKEEWFLTKYVPRKEEWSRGIFKRRPPELFMFEHKEILDHRTGKWRKPTLQEKRWLFYLALRADKAYYATKGRFWYLPLIRKWLAYRAATRIHSQHNKRVFDKKKGVYAMSEEAGTAELPFGAVLSRWMKENGKINYTAGEYFGYVNARISIEGDDLYVEFDSEKGSKAYKEMLELDSKASDRELSVIKYRERILIGKMLLRSCDIDGVRVLIIREIQAGKGLIKLQKQQGNRSSREKLSRFVVELLKCLMAASRELDFVLMTAIEIHTLHSEGGLLYVNAQYPLFYNRYYVVPFKKINAAKGKDVWRKVDLTVEQKGLFLSDIFMLYEEENESLIQAFKDKLKRFQYGMRGTINKYGDRLIPYDGNGRTLTSENNRTVLASENSVNVRPNALKKSEERGTKQKSEGIGEVFSGKIYLAVLGILFGLLGFVSLFMHAPPEGILARLTPSSIFLLTLTLAAVLATPYFINIVGALNIKNVSHIFNMPDSERVKALEKLCDATLEKAVNAPERKGETRLYYIQDIDGGGKFQRASLQAVDVMFRKMRFTKGKRFLDVGSGDGRVVFLAAMHGLDATGVERDKRQKALIEKNEREGVDNNLFERGTTHWLWEDVMDIDLSQYDVIFLHDGGLNKDKEKLEEKIIKEGKGSVLFVVMGERWPYLNRLKPLRRALNLWSRMYLRGFVVFAKRKTAQKTRIELAQEEDAREVNKAAKGIYAMAENITIERVSGWPLQQGVIIFDKGLIALTGKDSVIVYMNVFPYVYKELPAQILKDGYEQSLEFANFVKEEISRAVKEQDNIARILAIGPGSGLDVITVIYQLSVIKKVRQLHIDAVELSVTAVENTKTNIVEQLKHLNLISDEQFDEQGKITFDGGVVSVRCVKRFHELDNLPSRYYDAAIFNTPVVIRLSWLIWFLKNYKSYAIGWGNLKELFRNLTRVMVKNGVVLMRNDPVIMGAHYFNRMGFAIVKRAKKEDSEYVVRCLKSVKRLRYIGIWGRRMFRKGSLGMMPQMKELFEYYKSKGKEEWFVTKYVPCKEDRSRGIFKRGPPQEFADGHTELYDAGSGIWREPTAEEKETLLNLARRCDKAYSYTKNRFWYLPIIRYFIAYRAAVKVHAAHNKKGFDSKKGIYGIAGKLPEQRKYNVLILCRGNQERSPMAQKLVEMNIPADLKGRLIIGSAGINGPVDDLGLEMHLRRHPLLRRHYSVKVTEQQLRQADIIFVMTVSQVKSLLNIDPSLEKKILLLLEGRNLEVSYKDDYPEYGPTYKGLEQTIRNGLEGIFDRIRARIKLINKSGKRNPAMKTEFKYLHKYYQGRGKEEWFVTKYVPRKEEWSRGIFTRWPPQGFVDAHPEVYDVRLGDWRKISEEEKEKLLRIARECDQAYYRTKKKFWFLPIIRNFIAYRSAVKVHSEHNRTVFNYGRGIYAITSSNGKNGKNGKGLSPSELKKRDVAFRKLMQEIKKERFMVWKKVMNLEPAISVLGSARIAVNHFVYAQGQRIGEACAARGIPVRTGGGPSMMEAPFVGSIAVRRTKGWGLRRKIFNQAINIIFTDKEDPNPYGEISLDFNRFITRKYGLTENILGGIFVSGGYGTLDEFFEFWRRGKPVVLFGSGFYTPIVEEFFRFLEANNNTGEISYRNKFYITDDPQAAVDHIIMRAQEDPMQVVSKKKQKEIIRGFQSGLYALKYRPRSVVFQGRPKSNLTIEFAKQLTRRIAEESSKTKQGIGIRAGTLGPLYNCLSDEARLLELHREFEAVVFSTNGDKRLKEDSLIFGRNIISLQDESNQQLLSTYNAHAFVFFPGAVGTMNRLFDILCVMQTNKISRRPIIVVDDNGSWKTFFMKLRDKMYNEWRQAGLDFALISKEDIDFLQFIDVRNPDALEAAMRSINRQVVLDNGDIGP